MSAAPAILDPRAAWLAERRNHIGASDVAAILGVDPRRGPLAVYAAKVGDIDQDETRWMKFGRKVEGAIADWYSDDTGRRIEDLGAHQFQRHPDTSFIAATLDRVTYGSDAHPAPIADPRSVPLECKAVAGFKTREWQEDPPLHYQVQLQAQLACTGAQWGSLVALIGGIAIAWKDVVRNDGFLAAALPKLEEFWLRVQRREPPEPDALPGTTDAIRRLWPGADGKTVALDHEALSMMDALESVRASVGAAKEAERGLANKVRARMGEASWGALPDGSFVRRQLVERDGYEVEETKYTTVKRWRPRLPARRR